MRARCLIARVCAGLNVKYYIRLAFAPCISRVSALRLSLPLFRQRTHIFLGFS